MLVRRTRSVDLLKLEEKSNRCSMENETLGFPEKGHPAVSAGAKQVVGEIVKVCASAVDPLLGAGAAVGGALFSAVGNYIRAKRQNQLNECLSHFRTQIRKQEGRLAKLEAATKEDDEPLSNSFAAALAACYQEDESQKAPFYAAFMVGMLEKGDSLSPQKRTRLFDALKRARSHDACVLLICYALAKEPAREITVQTPLGEYRSIESAIETAKKNAHVPVDLDLIPQSLSVLHGLGLILQETSAQITNLAGMSKHGFYLTDAGQALTDLIQPYLE